MAAPLPEDPAAAQQAQLRAAQQAYAQEQALQRQQQGAGGEDTVASLGQTSSQQPPLCDTVFSMAFGGRTLLARTRLHLERGRRYGLVGANGAGFLKARTTFQGLCKEKD
jgi:ABC-type molybdenum transport system ATPase subunit/photorepair protein PhrA